MADFPLVPAKTALLFFDTLNGYLHPSEPEKQAALAQLGILDTLQKANREFRAAGMTVFYAQADHRPDHRDVVKQIVGMGFDGDRTGGPRLWGTQVAVAGSWAQGIVDEIAPQPGDYVIKKHRWSTFFQTHFELS